MRVMKYRRRQDGGITRVYVGSRRKTILEVLIKAGSPLSAQGLACAADALCAREVRLTTVQSFLQHLLAAGWVDINDENMVPTYMLNYGGEAYAAFLLAPVG